MAAPGLGDPPGLDKPPSYHQIKWRKSGLWLLTNSGEGCQKWIGHSCGQGERPPLHRNARPKEGQGVAASAPASAGNNTHLLIVLGKPHMWRSDYKVVIKILW